jgi:Zn-dependent protease
MDLTPETLQLGLVWYLVFLFSTTLHEAAHALVAHRLGDSTAERGGQVTLNPWPHLRREPFGMVLIPILSFVWSGWMMGWASAPYDPRWAERYPKRAAAMALAGPAANLSLVLVAFLGIRIGLAGGWLMPPDTVSFSSIVAASEPGAAAIASLLSILFTLNLLLCAFNLLPLPPLDGSGVLPMLLPESAARAYREALRQPMVALLGIVLAWRIFGRMFWPLFATALGLLYPDVVYR